MVKIYAGDRKDRFILPSDLLADYSPYLAACFNTSYDFKEAVEGVLRLSEERPDFVKIPCCLC